MNHQKQSEETPVNEKRSEALHQRLRRCWGSAWPPALKTGLWLLAVTVPVSFAVLLLKLTGVLGVLAQVFEPVFSLFGLPGEAALVYVTACLLNIYACIAVIETLGLTGRAVTILALMCLISHSLLVEGAVQKKAGSAFVPILLTRVCASLVGALVLSVWLPPDGSNASLSTANEVLAVAGFGVELKAWAIDMSLLCAKIMVLVTLLTVLERMLAEFGVTHFLARIMKYPLMLLGIPHQAAFLWIVANTLGLAYGAGVIIDQVKRGCLSRKHPDILNYHIAVSHSLLEDTCLFVAIGASAGWITIPRIILAGIVVWLKRLLG